MDWKKEIKFSDLVPKRKAETKPRHEAEPTTPAAAPAPPSEPAAPSTPAAFRAVEYPQPPAAPVPAAPLSSPPPGPAVPASPAPGIHPPVTAAELPKQKTPKAKRASLLKREISFGRKPKKQKAAPEPSESTPPRQRALKFGKPRKGRDQASHKRQKRLVGLKIGGSQLAAARILNNGSPELVQLARQELEQGVVVGGELRDPDALTEALKSFFREHKLPKQGVRLGIANNRIGVRSFDVSGIDDPKQLENAIRFRAQEALPIPIEDAVLDYHVLSERVDADGNTTRRILLVVAYRELVDRYVAACKKAGIKLAGVDLEAFALLRALAEPRSESAPPADAALVVVAIGHDRSTFAVSDGRVCEFTRVLDWGGGTLSVAVARALDLAPSEAEPYKRALSLAVEETPQGMTDEQAAMARDALRKQLQAFARELVSSLQFYQNQPGSLGIGEIVLTGGTAHLHGLADELQRLIGVRVRVGDPLTRLTLGKKIKETEQVGSLAVAIGLGIED